MPGNSTNILLSPLCKIVGSLVPTSSILLLTISIDCFNAELFIVSKPYLEKVIKQYAEEIRTKDKESWLKDQWTSIILTEGSVQHLDWMSDWHKKVFKTAFELDQRWIVDHAGDRQEFICQGQSVNLFFPAGTDKAYVNEVHIRAWKKKLKGLYYLRTNSGVSAEKVSQVVKQDKLKDFDDDDCLSCQG